MLILRSLAALALAPAMLGGALPPALVTTGVAAFSPRAEVAVRFDEAGRIAAAAVVRSSGSQRRDAAAESAARELASLQPAAAAGQTRVFRIAFED